MYSDLIQAQAVTLISQLIFLEYVVKVRKLEDIILRSEEFLPLGMGEIKPPSFKENDSNTGTVIKNYLFESSIQNPNKGSFKWKWIKP